MIKRTGMILFVVILLILMSSCGPRPPQHSILKTSTYLDVPIKLRTFYESHYGYHYQVIVGDDKAYEVSKSFYESLDDLANVQTEIDGTFHERFDIIVQEDEVVAISLTRNRHKEDE